MRGKPYGDPLNFYIQFCTLNYTPIGARALRALGATHYVCPRQTAEEQSAAFALISELLDANCLDYAAARQGRVRQGTTKFN